MFMRNLLIIVACFPTVVLSQTTPDLGRPLTQTELAILPSNVFADGSGLPEGTGTVSEGAEIYQSFCAACHGETGEHPRLPLAGGLGSLTDDAPRKTVGSFWPLATTLYDYSWRAMPYNAPKSMSADETYAVVAYILHLNGILPANARLGSETLADITMPNEFGFQPSIEQFTTLE